MRYKSFSKYLKDKYGQKVRRISLDAGFTCPTRDGTKGSSGCIFCNEKGFSDLPGGAMSLDAQIRKSIERQKDRTGAEKFIAYFQNASGTYAPVDRLKASYDVIRKYPEIVALYISTRPDCVNDEILDLVESYTGDYEVWIEYGMQTMHDKTLRGIRRGHTHAQTREAIEKTSARGIKCGVHIILGLPGETREDMMETAREIARLPVSGVKLHVLHVLKNTELAEMYSRGEVRLLTRDEYVDIVSSFLENLPDDCIILRLVSDARKDFLVAPGWINDKLSVIGQIESELEKKENSSKP